MQVTLCIWSIGSDMLIHRETHVSTVSAFNNCCSSNISPLKNPAQQKCLFILPVLGPGSAKPNKTDTFSAFTGQTHERNNYKYGHRIYFTCVWKTKHIENLLKAWLLFVGSHSELWLFCGVMWFPGLQQFRNCRWRAARRDLLEASIGQ